MTEIIFIYKLIYNVNIIILITFIKSNINLKVVNL